MAVQMQSACNICLQLRCCIWFFKCSLLVHICLQLTKLCWLIFLIASTSPLYLFPWSCVCCWTCISINSITAYDFIILSSLLTKCYQYEFSEISKFLKYYYVLYCCFRVPNCYSLLNLNYKGESKDVVYVKIKCKIEINTVVWGVFFVVFFAFCDYFCNFYNYTNHYFANIIYNYLLWNHWTI